MKPKEAEIVHKIHFINNSFTDVFLHFCLTCPVTYILTRSPSAVFYFSVVTVAVILFNPFRTNKSKDTFEGNWLNWFEVSKLIGGLGGVIVIHLLRIQYLLPETGQIVVAVFLALNILEAVVQDAFSGWYHYPNAFIGLLLLIQIPFSSIHLNSVIDGVFLFPLSPWWITFYTFWNATFSYGFNYSHTTRLILLSPLFVSFYLLNMPDSWLSARCFSLMLNMIFRAAQISYLYSPGKCALTPLAGSSSLQHNKPLFFVLSCINLVLFFAHSLWVHY